jgi:hypothetical protein
MKLTKGVVNRMEAVRLAPDYVAFVNGNDSKFKAVDAKFSQLRVGQRVLTYSDGTFVIAKVSSIRIPNYEADGPVVRVSNGEYSWRVDGDRYAYPVAV